MGFILIGILIGLVIGFLLGIFYRKKVAEKEISSAEEEAKRIINESIKSAGALDGLIDDALGLLFGAGNLLFRYLLAVENAQQEPDDKPDQNSDQDKSHLFCLHLRQISSVHIPERADSGFLYGSDT